MNSPTLLTRRPALRSAAAIFLVTALTSGCAPVSPTAVEDRALFERLCNAPDRNFVKYRPRVAGYAEGYESGRSHICPISDFPFKRLIVEGYSHYECFTGAWGEREYKPLKALRIELKSKGDQTCEHPRLSDANKIAEREAIHSPQLQGRCFGGEELEVPSSDFVVTYGGGMVRRSGEHLIGLPENWANIRGSIAYSRLRIIDRRNGEIIAERKAYSYFPSGAGLVDLAGYEKCKEGWGSISELFSPLPR